MMFNDATGGTVQWLTIIALVVCTLAVATTGVSANSDPVVETAIDVGERPMHLAVDDESNRLYVANTAEGTVTVIDTTSKTVAENISVGERPDGIGINTNTDTIYLADRKTNEVYVIDTTTNDVVDSIAMPASPANVDVSSYQNKAYVSLNCCGKVSIIDTETRTISTTVSVGERPRGADVHRGTSKAFVANARSQNVSIIKNDSVVGSVPVGDLPLGVHVDQETDDVYVPNAFSDNMSIIDANTEDQQSSVALGSTPRFLAEKTENDHLYVSHASDLVSVYNQSSGQVESTLTVNGRPHGIQVDSSTGTTYVAQSQANTVSAIVDTSGGVISNYSVDNPENEVLQVSFESAVTLDTIAVYVKNETEDKGVTVLRESEFEKTGSTYRATLRVTDTATYRAILSHATDGNGNDYGDKQEYNETVWIDAHPNITNYTVSNPEKEILQVSFDSDEPLEKIAVGVRNETDDESVGVLRTEDFTREGSTYIAQQRVTDTATYHARLGIAGDEHGNNAGDPQKYRETIDINAHPVITNYTVSNPEKEILQVSFDSDEPLAKIGVGVRNETDETGVGPLRKADFSKDGTTYTARQRVSATATYGARLFIAEDAHGNDAGDPQKYDESIFIEVNEPPTAEFEYSPDNPTTADTIQFDGSFSKDPDGSVVSHDWSFGDGTTASGVNASHSYADDGNYSVTLTVTDDYGATASVTRVVEVQNVPPVAAFELDPDPAEVEENVSFDGTLSSDSDGSVIDYKWTFGDGSVAYESTVQHGYTQPGTYTVDLKVIDDDGAYSLRNRTIEVVVFKYALEVDGTAIGPPTDPDGDGLFEDVDGDDSLTGSDTVAFKNVVEAYNAGDLTLADAQVDALDFDRDGDLDRQDLGRLSKENGGSRGKGGGRSDENPGQGKGNGN
jgi:YVTN family beta-propeller protein